MGTARKFPPELSLSQLGRRLCVGASVLLLVQNWVLCKNIDYKVCMYLYPLSTCSLIPPVHADFFLKQKNILGGGGQGEVYDQEVTVPSIPLF